MVITERGKAVGRIVPIKPPVEAQVPGIAPGRAGAWNGFKLAPMAPVAQTRGKRTVAELLLEDRDFK